MFKFILWIFGSAFAVVAGIGFLRILAIKRPLPPETNTFFDRPFEIVAHRGGSLEAPENTLAAFENAMKLGPEIALELDVHFTQDNQIVVFHDRTLERTTNGTGPLASKTLEELRSLDAGYHFNNEAGEPSFRGKGVKIPTLEEVLKATGNHRLIIEVKALPRDGEKLLVDLITESNAQDRIMLGSQDSTLLKRIKKLAPKWNYCATKDEVLRIVMLMSLYLEPAGDFASPAFLIPEKDKGISVLSERLISEVHRRGKKVLIWTVNTEDDMRRLIAQGVDGLISDRPSLLYKVAKAR